MEKTAHLIEEYNLLMLGMKKEFKNAYNKDDNLYEAVNNGVSYLEEKIADLRIIKKEFEKQKKELEANALGLEGEIELIETLGNKDNLKTNVLGIKKFYLEIYNDVEDNANKMLKYFDSTLKNIKDSLSNEKIKTAITYLDNLTEALK